MSRLLSAAFFMLFFAAFAGATSLPAAADETAPQAPALVPILVASGPVSALAHRGAKAPADEYFGQFKMSILGVRNVVHDVDGRADDAAEEVANNLCHKLILAEDALRDWQAKYPDDSWIPKFGYAMVKDYEKVDSDIIADASHVASIHAIDLEGWLDSTYPNSEYAPK